MNNLQKHLLAQDLLAFSADQRRDLLAASARAVNAAYIDGAAASVFRGIEALAIQCLTTAKGFPGLAIEVEEFDAEAAATIRRIHRESFDAALAYIENEIESDEAHSAARQICREAIEQGFDHQPNCVCFL
jgi:hypothetical protein